MKLTAEQDIILKHVVSTEDLTKVSAVAGSGKTTLLTAIAKALPEGTGLYLAYNKSVATEAQRKFPKWVHCCTTHSLAYQAIFKSQKLFIADFSYRSITMTPAYEVKCAIVEYINEYCLSKYVTFAEYAKANSLNEKVTTIGQHYVTLMSQGKIGCTHAFYLKLYHAFLANGLLEYPEFDFLALDEAGDLNEVTLEIFKLLPAKRKILVGDPDQNVYTFNHTINCFSLLKDKGTYLPMSQSFRVKNTIANKIEKYCQTYLNPIMNFKGIEIKDTSIASKLYIARTNSSLINKMMELNRLQIPYGLVRSAKQIFGLHLTLIALKYKGFVADPQYKFLQDDTDNYHSDRELQDLYKSNLNYIKEIHSYDRNLGSAITMIFKYGPKKIIECYEEARKHEKRDQTYELGSAHSCKGLEADCVELADDMNLAIDDIIMAIDNGKLDPDDLTVEQRTELNLYYIACSRARKELINAEHLS